MQSISQVKGPGVIPVLAAFNHYELNKAEAMDLDPTQEIVENIPEFEARIPIIDMNDLNSPLTHARFINGMKEAFRTYGFVQVRRPHVSPETIDAAYQASQDFFSLPMEQKCKSNVSMDGQRGYVPGETAKGSATADIKEFYHIGREPNATPNIWPKDPNFKEAMCALFNALESYIIPFQEAMAEALGLENKNLFTEMTKDGEVLLRTLHYFANPPEGSTWAAEHTDIDLFTILPRATANGLEVFCDGTWVKVKIPEENAEDTFIINCGDMLENMSNGIFKSAKHRVVPEGTDQDRYSMVLFIHPRQSDSIGPLPECIASSGGVAKYANGTRTEFLLERLIELKLIQDEGIIREYADSGHTERQIEVGRASVQVMEKFLELGIASEKVQAYTKV